MKPMSRRDEDIAAVVFIILILMASFGASATWEIVLIGALIVGCIGLLLRKRS